MHFKKKLVKTVKEKNYDKKEKHLIFLLFRVATLPEKKLDFDNLGNKNLKLNKLWKKNFKKNLGQGCHTLRETKTIFKSQKSQGNSRNFQFIGNLREVLRFKKSQEIFFCFYNEI